MRKHNQQLLFFKLKHTLAHQIKYYMYEIKFTSHKKYLFGPLFSKHAKKTNIKAHYNFIFILTELKQLTDLQK